jgi:hypothetical protein
MILIKTIDNFLAIVACWVIRFYQKSLSPDHGIMSRRFPHGYCRFRPTCSEYSLLAFSKYGFLKGGLLALGRILRCHPWSKGGWDPLR